MIKTNDIQVGIDQLLLDPNNYRLADELEVGKVSDKDVEELQESTLTRLKKQRLGELIDSILNNGFLEMERVVVRLLKSKSRANKGGKEKYVVVEGNRRTAALKSIQQEFADKIEDGIIKYKSSLPMNLQEKFEKINVQLIDGDEEQIQDYSATLMGIRHVAGPKKWDGFQSAKLINDLFYDGKSFTKIGALIGISNREVGRRFRGYQAFKQMKASTEYSELVESRHYGLLLEFLSSTKSGKSWLEWDDEKYEFTNEKNLSIVYKALTANSQTGEKPEIRNPGDARKFVSLLDTSYKVDIESGSTIHNMPDPDDLKPSGKMKRIISFKSFIERGDFTTPEEDELEALLVILQDKLG
ncbi:ParB/Srx family N-terminal domain-containing protein [Shewanella frigidimarina]|uniref:ParB/Srx family N-terminal domain-containing protein n=1 Tax=Shewanella frigidimarina TaxID=56812 RepID=UPI000B06CCC1|nr:ParB/Srx family N-terminal domain-containing protein [Shewanella frigidimarina]